MRARLALWWELLRESYWFVPTVMMLAGVAVAAATLRLDHALGGRWPAFAWLYGGSADGARVVLGTIAGSMIGVAGVVFSITIVSLTLASNQFGPRLLRNFMRDLGTQLSLGTFVVTFLYCLLVIWTVRGGESGFVPFVSVTLAMVLAVTSLAVLVYYIHHIAAQIQASNVIAGVARDLTGTIDRLCPEGDSPGDETGIAPTPHGPGAAIASERSGYLAVVSGGDLVELARERDLLIRLRHRPGRWVLEGSPIAEAFPPDRVDDEVRRRIVGACILGQTRTLAQDVEFAVEQLVEVGVRALSPGVNDPFTAVTCIDVLGDALRRVATRPPPPSVRRDDEHVPRVVEHPITFPALLDAAFNQLRQYGMGSVAVTIRLLETLAAIAAQAVRADDLAALREHVEEIRARSAAGGRDRLDVEDRAAVALDAIARRERTIPPVQEPVSPRGASAPAASDATRSS
jgi:uncharacterized membrane protein